LYERLRQHLGEVFRKLALQKQSRILTDVARLIWAQDVLSGDCERVIWVDANVVVFDPGGLVRHVEAV
jgi:hypothetical protein